MQKQIRSSWVKEQEKWYFSIVDVAGVLSDSPNPNNYWKVLKDTTQSCGSEKFTGIIPVYYRSWNQSLIDLSSFYSSPYGQNNETNKQ